MNDKNLIIRKETDHSLNEWREKEKTALELLQVVGELRFDRAIELVLFRKDIYDSRPSEVLNQHLVAANYIEQPIPIELSLGIAITIAAIKDLAPSKIDIGKLAIELMEASADVGGEVEIVGFVRNKLSAFIGAENNTKAAKDVVLYGFGRIGRLAARRLISMTGKGEQLRLKAIVLRPKLKSQFEETVKRAALLQHDTVHGEFRGTIDIPEDGSEIIVNGNRIQMIYAKSPAEIDYTVYGIKDAIVIDNTGVWRDKAGLSEHLRPGTSHVLLTAPGNDIENIVYGVNQNVLDNSDDKVMSAASCTTNAIVPLIKLMKDNFGIAKGHIETIHAYTNDQNLIDNFHKKPRRGRGAATNMVLTTTGAAKAVSKVIPELSGKLTGNAIRVPTPNVSIAIMNLTVDKPTSVDEVNELVKAASLKGDLVEQLSYSTSTEFVSSNAVGSTATSVFDAPSTIVSKDGLSVTLYAWYDNEFGYTCQVLRLAKYVAKVRRYAYY